MSFKRGLRRQNLRRLGFERFEVFLQAADLFGQFLLFLVELFVFLFLFAELSPNRRIGHPGADLAQNIAEDDKGNDSHALRNRNFDIKRPQVKRCQIVVNKGKDQNNDDKRQTDKQFYETHGYSPFLDEVA